MVVTSLGPPRLCLSLPGTFGLLSRSCNPRWSPGTLPAYCAGTHRNSLLLSRVSQDRTEVRSFSQAYGCSLGGALGRSVILGLIFWPLEVVPRLRQLGGA